MKLPVGIVACAVLFSGCHTAKKVGVTTFRVLDAPANYIRHQIDDSERTTTTTTTRTTSDVANPGQPVPVTTSPRTTTSQQSRAVTQSAARPTRSTPTSTHTASSSAPRTTQQTQSFPTAKPVPGKPGFVISPYDPNGGYVDVTGYPSGSKAKDPYSQKIFIVP